MESKIIFCIGVERVLNVELISVAVFGNLVEFVLLRIGQFFLYLHVVIVLHDEDEICMLQYFICFGDKQTEQRLCRYGQSFPITKLPHHPSYQTHHHPCSIDHRD